MKAREGQFSAEDMIIGHNRLKHEVKRKSIECQQLLMENERLMFEKEDLKIKIEKENLKVKAGPRPMPLKHRARCERRG